jgi:isochorismate pyruvate lyase
MVEMTDQAALASCRAEIDALDAELVRLLGRRVEVVDRVIGIKEQHGIPALLPERVEEVVAHVREEATICGAPPDLAEILYRALIAWTVDYEERKLGSD